MDRGTRESDDQTMLIDRRQIIAARPGRNPVDPSRPYAILMEPEASAAGVVEDVATLFLVNSECPFTCVFCDLWKNTLTEPTPRGASPAQIRYALERLREDHPDRTPRHIKLYNSGNFFDRRVIPPEDHLPIADLVRGFSTVIVENHPRLCGDDVLRFRDLIAPAELEVAMGLETIHPDVLPRLNKGMTQDDFASAAAFLSKEQIAMRAFVLLQPPFLPEADAVEWALRSMAFAFDQGVRCCALIPTRGGNGFLEQLAAEGVFVSPRLTSLEAAIDEAVNWGRGRVFADLWDIERFADCQVCAAERRERLQHINWTQRPLPPVRCASCQ
jgi:radical SAM enzyme (TIGR01210 family)